MSPFVFSWGIVGRSGAERRPTAMGRRTKGREHWHHKRATVQEYQQCAISATNANTAEVITSEAHGDKDINSLIQSVPKKYGLL
ncbi:hypothetical protein FJTKL_04497 [Diaporthe vaccinii]|uniref:Uncharacterized protein n=1 Tax=Diaporthe vaccinii TaxID=105482 RepID=A0ABR4DTJ7_9PEZI